MSKLLRAGMLAGIVLGIANSSSPAIDRDAVNKAIKQGVKALRAMQTANGTWPYTESGATALAGLTLLECGAKPDDKAVLNAARAVRKASLSVTHIYSIALAILFFDRLGDPNDVPLIESLAVRLLAAQTPMGGWNYRSPPIGLAEARRLQTVLARRKELVGRREAPQRDAVKRTVHDLPAEIQQQLTQLDQMGALIREMGSDNSNTQFATLALWVARRYGLPVKGALESVEKRFRASQQADGGWGYFEHGRMVGPLARSTASMTCAGLLGLAVADANFSEMVRERKPGSKYTRDINKDTNLRKGLFALSTAIGQPPEATRRRRGDVPVASLGGRTYYFLWSLERVAVILDLKTIGKKDWYAWGAELLLANQQADGSWRGNYAACGADTCFALLFLKRANLVPDLTTELTGRVQDPGERLGKSGSEAKELEKIGQLTPGLESKDSHSNTDGRYPDALAKSTEPRSISKSERPASEKPPVAVNPLTSATARMGADLAKATGSRHELLLHNFRVGKGGEFTEALALAIPQLSGDRQRKARTILVERLTRMKDTTLSAYLGDEMVEIRRAAALACAAKKSTSLVPRLIPLLRDTRDGVSEPAHQALKELTGQDFGPKPDASREERMQATRKWLEWWHKQEDK